MVADLAPGNLLNFRKQSGTRCMPRPQGHIGLYDAALERIGLADNGCFRDRRVMQDCAFDLKRSDPVSGALDHVIGAALEPEISGLVAVREITRGDPAVPEERERALRVFPGTGRVVALHSRALGHMACRSGWQLPPFLIDDGHLEARHRQPHRAWLYL